MKGKKHLLFKKRIANLGPDKGKIVEEYKELMEKLNTCGSLKTQRIEDFLCSLIYKIYPRPFNSLLTFFKTKKGMDILNTISDSQRESDFFISVFRDSGYAKTKSLIESLFDFLYVEKNGEYEKTELYSALENLAGQDLIKVLCYRNYRNVASELSEFAEFFFLKTERGAYIKSDKFELLEKSGINFKALVYFSNYRNHCSKESGKKCVRELKKLFNLFFEEKNGIFYESEILKFIKEAKISFCAVGKSPLGPTENLLSYIEKKGFSPVGSKINAHSPEETDKMDLDFGSFTYLTGLLKESENYGDFFDLI